MVKWLGKYMFTHVLKGYIDKRLESVMFTNLLYNFIRGWAKPHLEGTSVYMDKTLVGWYNEYPRLEGTTRYMDKRLRTAMYIQPLEETFG